MEQTKEPKKTGKRILIVEDERPMGKALTLKFRSRGHEVTHALNGEEALQELEKGTYNIILLDLVMPKVDGFGVLAELKKRGNTTPVIVSSNLSQEEDAKRAREHGAVDYFIKSNTPITDVVARAEKVLEES